LTSHALTPTQARPENAALVDGNASASCLPVMEALALGGVREVHCLAAPSLGIRMLMQAS
jgi:hypothetical protein